MEFPCRFISQFILEFIILMKYQHVIRETIKGLFKEEIERGRGVEITYCQ